MTSLEKLLSQIPDNFVVSIDIVAHTKKPYVKASLRRQDERRIIASATCFVGNREQMLCQAIDIVLRQSRIGKKLEG